MVYTQALGDEPVLRGNHVAVPIVWKARAQTIAWLGGFPGADSIREDYEMGGRVEKLAGAEQFTGKTGAEKAAPVAGRAVENEDGVSHDPGRILSREPKGRVVNAQLGKYRSVSEAKVREGEIALSPRARPPGADPLIRCRTRRLREDCARADREYDKRPQHGRVRYDPRRPDFMDVAGGFPDLTGGAGGGCTTLVTSGTP
jgi:hypothetical protein